MVEGKYALIRRLARFSPQVLGNAPAGTQELTGDVSHLAFAPGATKLYADGALIG